MLRRHVLAAGLALAVWPVAARAASPALAPNNAAPEAVVARLYAIGTTSEVMGVKAQRARYFAPATATLIEKTFEKSRKLDEPGIDYEPLIDGQDGEVKDLKISVAERSDAAATVKAEFHSFDESLTVTFLMENVKGVWKVADIQGREGTSLVAVMNDFLKP